MSTRLAAGAAPAMSATLQRTLRPIYVNIEIEAAYRKHLQDLVLRMARDVMKRVRASYKPAAEQIGMDAEDPVVTLRREFEQMIDQWSERLEGFSKENAERFANQSQRYTDVAFRRHLRVAGFTVRFKPTARMKSAYRAVIAENVNLIKSIPQQFLKDVQTQVWTSAMKGGDLATLSQGIQKKYGVAYRRAAFIAADQSAKAKAIFEEARRSELGIEEAIWQHSHAGREPRPTHVAMNNERYKIKEGMWDSAVGRFVWPGTEPRCRCTSRSIMPSSISPLG